MHLIPLEAARPGAGLEFTLERVRWAKGNQVHSPIDEFDIAQDQS